MDRPTHATLETDSDGFTRREFLSAMLSTSLLAGVAGAEFWAAGAENGIPYRRLGRSRTSASARSSGSIVGGSRAFGSSTDGMSLGQKRSVEGCGCYAETVTLFRG